MTKAKPQYVVTMNMSNDPHQGGRLFTIPVTDSRLSGPNYKTVTAGRFTKHRTKSETGLTCRVFAGENGKTYLVYGDSSTKETDLRFNG